MLNSIHELQEIIEKALKESIPKTAPFNLYQPMDYMIDGGGKRLRPLLSILSCGLISNTPLLALNAGIAIELLHNFTLMHDDIMDRSPLRRGRQTVHIHWDESTAILSGDAMIGIAYRTLLSDFANHPDLRSIVNEFNEGLIAVCEGQAMDIEYSKKTDISIDDYLLMIEFKTAKLLQAAIACGAMAAQAEKDDVNQLKEFALYVGLAFQLQDDLLDLTAEQTEFGKSIGQDIVEGKKTFMMLLLRHKIGEQQHPLVQRFFDEHGLPLSYVSQIMELLQEYGIIEETKAKIKDYTMKAKKILSNFPANIYRESLISLTDSLSTRTK